MAMVPVKAACASRDNNVWVSRHTPNQLAFPRKLLRGEWSAPVSLRIAICCSQRARHRCRCSSSMQSPGRFRADDLVAPDVVPDAHLVAGVELLTPRDHTCALGQVAHAQYAHLTHGADLDVTPGSGHRPVDDPRTGQWAATRQRRFGRVLRRAGHGSLQRPRNRGCIRWLGQHSGVAPGVGPYHNWMDDRLRIVAGPLVLPVRCRQLSQSSIDACDLIDDRANAVAMCATIRPRSWMKNPNGFFREIAVPNATSNPTVSQRCPRCCGGCRLPALFPDLPPSQFLHPCRRSPVPVPRCLDWGVPRASRRSGPRRTR